MSEMERMSTLSRAVITMKMPLSCAECRFCRKLSEDAFPFCELMDDPEDDNLYRTITIDHMTCKSEWCPLKELPQKMELCGRYPQPDKVVPSFKIGWNAFHDKLIDLEETNNN